MRYEKHLPTYHQRRNQYKKSWVRPTLSPSPSIILTKASIEAWAYSLMKEEEGGEGPRLLRFSSGLKHKIAHMGKMVPTV